MRARATLPYHLARLQGRSSLPAMKLAHLQAIGIPTAPLCARLTAPGAAAVESRGHQASSARARAGAADAAPAEGQAAGCSGKSAWRSYGSIESVDAAPKKLARLKALAAALPCEWVATEKVHGANFCFETDGAAVEYASRTSRLGAGADFFNARTTMPRYHPFALEAFRLARAREPSLRRLLIYGEYFGGYYPGLPAATGLKKVQGGVAYSPEHHFYAFDVSLDGRGHMDFEEARALLLAAGFPLVAAPLRRGGLQELLEMEVETLRTALPALLGHAPLGQWDIAEGVVIRPLRESACPAGGERPMLKKKARAFWEATNQHGQAAKVRPQQAAGPVDAALERARAFVTENRLRAVISKSPELLGEGELQRLVGLFTRDVWRDFAQRHEEELLTLGKEEKALRRALGVVVQLFARERLPAIRADVG